MVDITLLHMPPTTISLVYAVSGTAHVSCGDIMHHMVLYLCLNHA